jgi:hypothetical protein
VTGEFVVKMTAPGILEFSMEGEPGLSVKVTAELSPEEEPDTVSDPLDDLANTAAIRNLDVDDLVVVSRAIEFARSLQDAPPSWPLNLDEWEVLPGNTLTDGQGWWMMQSPTMKVRRHP